MANGQNFSGEVERTFVTEDGERITKVRTTFGGTLYTSSETGQINQQEYSSKASQRAEVRQFQEKDTSEIEAEDLSDRYQAEATQPIGNMEPGTIEREKTKQQNMFVGFMAKDETPNDRVEAVRQYENMLKEMRNAKSQDEIQDIKQDYNIGGS